ncbi:MAG: DUF5615 family PIN-like protein [Methylocystis sp.]|uniref:DUF5615 family PIN-like protein n=1 Tax=Methylocystis sp. TaxID=1911079 RepID=UPI003DA22845
MRFLADENFPAEAVFALRRAGHDVVWICETASGASDEAVLAMATGDRRILLTFDKDFGEMAWRSDFARSCGIILFSPADAAGCVGRRHACGADRGAR